VIISSLWLTPSRDRPPIASANQSPILMATLKGERQARPQNFFMHVSPLKTVPKQRGSGLSHAPLGERLGPRAGEVVSR